MFNKKISQNLSYAPNPIAEITRLGGCAHCIITPDGSVRKESLDARNYLQKAHCIEPIRIDAAYCRHIGDHAEQVNLEDLSQTVALAPIEEVGPQIRLFIENI